jgi:hypothetical protein
MTDLTRVKHHNVGAVMRRARGRGATRTLSHFLHQKPGPSLTSCTRNPDPLPLPAPEKRDALPLPAPKTRTLSHFLHQKPGPSPCGRMVF